ncbi:trk system potassium uptake protein TrkA [Hydrogenispora ethanolica]|uniref:Trk system potassium uptake protein TrkA n=1 Tax=Hydrogenispora ethanolica TaxID=1082276 RepID=A0A4R1RYH8_HYDET|nr:TrkA family potassium uptake protein [Hydrogenispora ethanolica]TCL71564.1 trk system potassium uptake protein TrkA [Hydrogenispora ethanolica]
MFVIVVGCGRLGSRLARVLSEQGHDLVVIGQCEEFKRLGTGFDGVTVSGNPIDEDVLKKAGIEKAQALVAVTADDNINAMAAQIAKAIFRVPMVLARISDPEREEFFAHLGLNVVSPTNTGINRIIKLLNENRFTPFLGYINTDVAGINPLPEWIGRSLKDLPIPSDVRLVGILRNEHLVPADPKTVVDAADVLIIRTRQK